MQNKLYYAIVDKKTGEIVRGLGDRCWIFKKRVIAKKELKTWIIKSWYKIIPCQIKLGKRVK